MVVPTDVKKPGMVLNLSFCGHACSRTRLTAPEDTVDCGDEGDRILRRADLTERRHRRECVRAAWLPITGLNQCIWRTTPCSIIPKPVTSSLRCSTLNSS